MYVSAMGAHWPFNILYVNFRIELIFVLEDHKRLVVYLPAKKTIIETVAEICVPKPHFGYRTSLLTKKTNNTSKTCILVT